MSVVAAVERDLASVRGRDPALAESAPAAAALALAAKMDDPATSPNAMAMCAKELRDTMGMLWQMAPPERKQDWLDELGSRREARRAGQAGASG